MIYTTAIYANPEHTQVTGTDKDGNTETVAADFKLFRQPDHGPLGFVANGGKIAPYVAPVEPLPDLAPYQFRAMLALSGKQADLESFVEALPEPDKTVAKAKLEYSLTFRRDNDLVKAAEQALGLTSEELDGLWLSAASIT